MISGSPSSAKEGIYLNMDNHLQRKFGENGAYDISNGNHGLDFEEEGPEKACLMGHEAGLEKIKKFLAAVDEMGLTRFVLADKQQAYDINTILNKYLRPLHLGLLKKSRLRRAEGKA